MLFNKTLTTLIQCPGGKTASLTIPSSVTSIGDDAFQYCSGLTSITIPSGITSIGNYVFQYCTGLTSITIPSGITSLGINAYYGCTGLTSVSIPAGITSIGSYAFSACASLTSIAVDQANANYSSSNGMLFNKNQSTLIQCPGGKTGGLTIPSSVTSIGNYALAYCAGLTSLTIPASVTSTGVYAFASCTGLTSLTFPSSVTSLGDNALDSSTRLTSITLPSSLTSIGNSVFQNCTGLTTLTIPASVTSIGNYAFASCTGLTSLVIPAGVTSIGNYMLQNCTGLSRVTFLGNAPSTIGTAVFSGTGLTVYFFSGSTGFSSPTWQGRPSVNMGSSTPITQWVINQGFPYNTNINSDPNGHGVNLLMAYALNLDPKQSLGGSMPKPVIAGNQMSLTFYAGTTGVTYAVQTSTDLKNWTTTGVALSALDANNRCTATVTRTGNTNRFMRLVVVN